jgi:predicted O-methyltransferase YrrM
MSNFDKILNLKDGPVEYEMTGGGHLKMKNHSYPYSILRKEFEFLTNIIAENNLQRGYECATAFGISSTAIGLGFQKTNGMCVTMDAYVEEKYDNPGTYENMERQVYEASDGFKSVKHLIKTFDLSNHLFPEIGWSPDDTERSVRKHFNDPLDFVFIDAGHFESQMIKDINAVLPLLDKKYLMVFHDVYPWSFTENVHKHVYEVTGKRVQIVLSPPNGENMGIINNL